MTAVCVALVAAGLALCGSFGAGIVTEHVTGNGERGAVAFIVTLLALTTAAIVLV